MLLEVLTNPFWKIDRQLQEDLTPVLDTAGPFTRYIHRNQVQHLQQGCIGRKDTFSLGHLAKLPMVAFDDIRRIDQFANLG